MQIFARRTKGRSVKLFDLLGLAGRQETWTYGAVAQRQQVADRDTVPGQHRAIAGSQAWMAPRGRGRLRPRCRLLPWGAIAGVVGGVLFAVLF